MDRYGSFKNFEFDVKFKNKLRNPAVYWRFRRMELFSGILIQPLGVYIKYFSIYVNIHNRLLFISGHYYCSSYSNIYTYDEAIESPLILYKHVYNCQDTFQNFITYSYSLISYARRRYTDYVLGKLRRSFQYYLLWLRIFRKKKVIFKEVHEELIAVVWNPKNMRNFKDLGIDVDYFEE